MINTKIIPISDLRKFDMMSDFKLLFKMGFRDDAIMAILQNKYYMTEGTIRQHLPLRELKRDAQKELQANPLVVEYR